MRLYDYFRTEMNGSFKLCFKLMLQHNVLNNLLPMRTGEISFPVLMFRYFNVPVTQSVPVLFWFRVLDFHTLLGLGILATTGFLLVPVVSIGLFLLWMLLPPIMFLAHNRLQASFGLNPDGRIKGLLSTALKNLPQTWQAFLHAWTWTWLNWVIKLGVFAWIVLLFLNISIAPAVVGAIAGDLTSVLPIHGVAGAGTYEAGVMAGLTPFHIPPKQALQAAVNLHLFVLVTSLLGGALAFLISEKRSNE